MISGEALIHLTIALRTQRGLKLSFRVPDSEELFTCYAKDDAQKSAWIAQGERRGWELIEEGQR